MKSRSNISIGIVDGSSLYRKALIDALTSVGFHSFIQAENETAMLFQLSQNKPDVLIYDFYNSSEAFHLSIDKIKRLAPKTKLIVLSFDEGLELIDFCLDHGIQGYCDKNIDDFDSLAKGIEKIANGEILVIAKQTA